MAAGAISTTAVTVTTTATLLTTANLFRRGLVVYTDAAIYVGGPDVTSSTGIPIAAAGTWSDYGDYPYYAITASGTAAARVLEKQ